MAREEDDRDDEFLRGEKPTGGEQEWFSLRELAQYLDCQLAKVKKVAKALKITHLGRARRYGWDKIEYVTRYGAERIILIVRAEQGKLILDRNRDPFRERSRRRETRARQKAEGTLPPSRYVKRPPRPKAPAPHDLKILALYKRHHSRS